MQLTREITKIGIEMVACTMNCGGVSVNQVEGIVPRCLVLESSDREGCTGSVIVGINPGRSKQSERNFYIQNGSTYDQFVSYWQENIRDHPYYTRLRRLADQLNFNGPILWTELVKCENELAGHFPPLQTFRSCSQKYLKKELAKVPYDWPIIGVGTESYKALAYMFAERTVIGVPHPTGSFGQFHRLFEEKILSAAVIRLVQEITSNGSNRAVWLSAPS